MIEQYFSRRAVLSRLYAAPALEHREAFAEELCRQGYARPIVKLKIRLVSQLCRWLEHQGLGVQCLDEERIRTFHRVRDKRFFNSYSNVKTLTDFLSQLRASGVVPTPLVENKDSDLDSVEKDFTRYLLQERGLASVTPARMLREVRRFLRKRYGKGSIDLTKLTAKEVSRFILSEVRAKGPAATRTTATHLRSFLRFVYLRGHTRTDLSAAIPKLSNWRLAGIPKFLPPKEVEALLQSCDRSTPVGLRDHAILLLLARLGLRGGEVARMDLEDVNWAAGEIAVRGKGEREDRMPLPHDVGQALAAYLRDGRPECTSRRLFIRARAPHRGLASCTAICKRVQTALARAGLNPAFKGAHLLRHSLATNMLRKGNSLVEIGEVLRHQHPDTTEIYAKVDLEALRALAQQWKGAKA